MIVAQAQRVPLVLVGNKLDLQSERQVGREVAVNLSKSWGGVRSVHPCLECAL